MHTKVYETTKTAAIVFIFSVTPSENSLFAYSNTKAQFSCVTAQLISGFDFFIQIVNKTPSS